MIDAEKARVGTAGYLFAYYSWISIQLQSHCLKPDKFRDVSWKQKPLASSFSLSLESLFDPLILLHYDEQNPR